MKNKLINYILTVFFAIAFTLPVYASLDGPDDPDSSYDEPSAAPIDDWMMILAVVGLLIGSYYYFTKRKNAQVTIQK